MPAEHGEHPALVAWREMEKAVPREYPVERPVQRECAHVRALPIVVREVGAGEAEQVWRGIDARNSAAMSDQVCGNRLAKAAAQVEHGRVVRQKSHETIEPAALKERLGPAIARPGHAMTPI